MEGVGRISLAEVSLIEDPSDDERIDEGKCDPPHYGDLITSLSRVLAVLESEQCQQSE